MENRLVYICEICQTVLEEHHCKAQCPNCGRMFDCSDLPLIPANGAVDDAEGEFILRPGANPLDLIPPAAAAGAGAAARKAGAPEPQPSADGEDDANIANLP